MRKRISLFVLLLCISGLFIIQPAMASSEDPLSNDQVFDLLKEAFKAQSSLTLEFHTYNEVREILAPYFHEQYMDLFLEENLLEEENGYIVYGSDFALYFIPFFSYAEETKVVFGKEDKIYVYELFRSPTSGPLGYDDHYEIITIEKHNSSWIISDLQSTESLPEEIKMYELGRDTHQESTGKPWKSFLLWNPYKTTLYSLLEMEYRTSLYAGLFKGIF
ncbi:DUF3993 domain-containing protein [Fredinandcohnia humi]